MAEMLRVTTQAAALLHPVVLRQRQCRLLDHARYRRQPSRPQRSRVDGRAIVDQAALGLINRKHLAGEGPEMIDRGLRAGMTLLGAITEPDDPFRAMPHMIGAFLLGLGG